MEVVRLGMSRGERLRFLRAGTAHYRDEPRYVRPLVSDFLRRTDAARNPFFRHAEVEHMVAVRDGRDVGRVAAIRNRASEEARGDRAGWFGWFECEEDPEAARALMDAARRGLATRGCDAVLGPASYSTNDECGLLVEGFEGFPALMMPWNPPWYEGLLRGAGLAPAEDLLAWRLLHDDVQGLDRIARVVDRARERHGWTVRPLRMADFEADLGRIRAVYNGAWERNWGFVPMTEEEFRWQAEDLRRIVRPEMVLLAEREGATVGFLLALPDFNQVLRRLGGTLLPFGWLKALWWSRSIDEVRVLTLGVLPEARNRGIEAGLYLEVIRRSRDLGFQGGECSWTLQRNEGINRIMDSLGAKPYRKYRIYRGDVAPASATTR